MVSMESWDRHSSFENRSRRMEKVPFKWESTMNSVHGDYTDLKAIMPLHSVLQQISVEQLQGIRLCSSCYEIRREKDSPLKSPSPDLNGQSFIKLCFSQAVEKVEPKSKKKTKESKSMGNTEKTIKGSQLC